MAEAFEPRFADLVRNYTSTIGTGNFVLGNAAPGYRGFAAALNTGDRFYYCATGIDRPTETEVGRGTLLGDGSIGREAVEGPLTAFTKGLKTLSLVAAAEWHRHVGDMTANLLFTDIAERRIAASVSVIETIGRTVAGRSCARYVRDADQTQYGAAGQALIDAGKLTAAQAIAILDRIRTRDASGVYWVLDEPVRDVGHFGAIGDGAANDTAAIQAAIDYAHYWGGGQVRIGQGKWVVSALRVRADVNLLTAGPATRIKQLSGAPVGTRVINIVGSNVEIGSLTVEGNIATDTGQQNHAIFLQANASTGNLQAITIGDIEGVNVRGDTIYVGTTAGYSLSNVRIGDVKGSNVYRNVLSIVGGRNIDVKSVTGSAVGYMHFLVEPNAGSGGASGIRAGYVRGRFAGVAPPTAADCAEGIQLGTLDLDPSHSSSSTPPFSEIALPTIALQLRNCRDLQIDTFLANGFDGSAIAHACESGWLANGWLNIGLARITNCALGNPSAGYVAGTNGVTLLTVGTLIATTTLSGQSVLLACSNHQVGTAVLTMAPGTTYLNYLNDGQTDRILMTPASGGGGNTLLSCNRCRINGGSVVGERLASYSAKCSFRGLTVTASFAPFVNGDDHDVRNCTINSTHYGDSLAPSTAAANFAAVAHAVNTVGKYGGKLVWDSTNARLMRASGSSATAAWHGVAGGVVVTPA